MSVSGTYERYKTVDGVRYHHIIDTKTGRPVNNGLLSVAVISENGAEAEELTKENAPHTLVTITEENKDTAIGTLQVIPQKETATASGVFMGRIHFDISLINTSEE